MLEYSLEIVNFIIPASIDFESEISDKDVKSSVRDFIELRTPRINLQDSMTQGSAKT